jgi:hypothetical protein
MTNWLVRFNGTDETQIIGAPSCEEAILQAEESSQFHVRSVQFHSTAACVSTEMQYHDDAVRSATMC